MKNSFFQKHFLNPIQRIHYTHILAILILVFNALLFTQNTIGIIVQLLLAVIIFFHNLDDEFLKKTLSAKIHELEEHEKELNKIVSKELEKNKKINTQLEDQLIISKKAEHEAILQKSALDEHAIVVITDANGIIQYVNDKFVAISGFSEEELIGKSHRILSSGVHSREFWKEMFETTLNKKAWHQQICNKTKNGYLYWLDTTFLALFDEYNQHTGFIAIRTDITKSKLNEKALQEQTKRAQLSTEAKSAFLANMSHEIRTPLNAILGFVNLIKEESTDQKTKEYSKIIEHSSQNLLKIIQDILDLSKIETGKLQIEMTECETQQELKLVTDLFLAKAQEKNINIHFNMSKNVPKYIKSDIFRIKQVVSNLISNAIKFTDENKHIYVSIDYKHNHLLISVKDEGKGIAPEKLQTIFEPFLQEDNTTTRKFGGTGLGLTISKNLITLLGGELNVKSKINEGSEFYFRIPVEAIESIQSKNEKEKHYDFSNKKVIIVEDDIPNQMFLMVIFKKLNLQYDIANDGAEAVTLFLSSKYDAILMDENMPNMSGMEATKKILELEKLNNTAHTPIIMLTANALKGDKEKFLAAGADQYLTKPVNKTILCETFESVFKQV